MQITSAPWLQFTHPDVRDLAFILACPPLLHVLPEGFTAETSVIDLQSHVFWLNIYNQYLPRLVMLDLDPTPLIDLLAQTKSTRLGLRFETLLHFWLRDEAWHTFHLIAKGVKRMQGKHTIGEIDFLVMNTTSQLIEHWEVTLKFYLGEKDLAPDHWVGLNRTDTLGAKLRHTVQHQFNCNEIVVAGITYPIQLRRAIIKGRLFYPSHNIMAAPDWFTTTQLTGTWSSHPETHLNLRRAMRCEWLTERISTTQISRQPIKYWTNGLYLAEDSSGQVISRHMLRLPRGITPHLKTHMNNI